MLSSISSNQSLHTKLLYTISNPIIANEYGLPTPTLYIPIRDSTYANWANGTPSLTNLSTTNGPNILTLDQLRPLSQYMNFAKASTQQLNLPQYDMTNMTSFSVSMWVKLKTGNNDFSNMWCITNFYRLVTTDTTKKYTWAVLYVPSSSYIRFEYARDGSEGTVRRGLTQTGIAIDTWYHIVAIQKADNSMEFWINNVKCTSSISGTNATTAPYRTWTSTYHVCGNSSYANDTATSMQLDDFRFYSNTVLTAAQIQTLYEAKNQTFDFIN